MPIGAGLSPAGLAAAGYGVPDLSSVPLNAVLPDLKTGLPQTGRYLNPVTKDYQFTADGRIQGMGTVPQLVQLALTTTLGTCAVPTLGQAFAKIREKGPGFRQQLTAAVSAALAPLIKTNQVQIRSIVVNDYPSAPDAGLASVSWVDLTTGLQQSTTVGA